jgi:hypothetical protein
VGQAVVQAVNAEVGRTNGTDVGVDVGIELGKTVGNSGIASARHQGMNNPRIRGSCGGVQSAVK